MKHTFELRPIDWNATRDAPDALEPLFGDRESANAVIAAAPWLERRPSLPFGRIREGCPRTCGVCDAPPALDCAALLLSAAPPGLRPYTLPDTPNATQSAGDADGTGGDSDDGALVDASHAQACDPLGGQLSSDGIEYIPLLARWGGYETRGSAGEPWVRRSPRLCGAGRQCVLVRSGGGVCEDCLRGQYCPPGTANPLRMAGFNPCPPDKFARRT